jgi:hypothetical protein
MREEPVEQVEARVGLRFVPPEDVLVAPFAVEDNPAFPASIEHECVVLVPAVKVIGTVGNTVRT